MCQSRIDHSWAEVLYFSSNEAWIGIAFQFGSDWIHLKVCHQCSSASHDIYQVFDQCVRLILIFVRYGVNRTKSMEILAVLQLFLPILVFWTFSVLLARMRKTFLVSNCWVLAFLIILSAGVSYPPDQLPFMVEVGPICSGKCQGVTLVPAGGGGGGGGGGHSGGELGSWDRGLHWGIKIYCLHR